MADGSSISKIEKFTQLADTFSSYVGKGNQLVSVKGTQDGLETIPQSAGPVSTFLALTDTPASYTGAMGQYVFINPAENALIFRFNNIRTSVGTATLTQTDYTVLIDASGGDCSASIPAPGAIPVGIIFKIKKIDSSINVVRISRQIDNIANYTLTQQNQEITIQNDGANYWII